MGNFRLDQKKKKKKESFIYRIMHNNYEMSETVFQKRILDRLSHMEKGINIMKEELGLIKERIVDDSILSEDDKKAINEALKEEKEGRLLSKKQVFG